MIRLKYSDASTYDLSVADLQLGLSQDLPDWHTPYSNQVGAVRLGLGMAKITAKGTVTARTVAKWHDIVAVSLDSGTTWQTVYFSDVSFSDDQWTGLAPYSLMILVSPVREGAVVRYPGSGYQWGDSSIASISQAGNVPAYATLYYLGPQTYWPLTNDLVDFAGLGITFTRALAKSHGGITYAINKPAFDAGLYLASDTSTDVGKVTLPTTTLKTVAMQMKQTRYPSPWVIGAGAGTANLLTANQSNAETDTTGMAASGGTFTRNTVTPIAGTGDFKIVATGGASAVINTGGTKATTVAGQWYSFQALLKTSGCAGGRKINLNVVWYQSDGTTYISEEGLPASVDAPTVATLYGGCVKAPALGARAMLQMWIVSAAASEILYADSLMIEPVPNILTIWTATLNKLTIDVVNSLVKWTDDTTTVQATFPTASYMTKIVVDIVIIENTSHAVTVAAHAAGGGWTTQTGTLAAIAYPELTLGPLEGSLANLVLYDYALASGEYQAMDYSLAPIRLDNLFVINKYAGTITKTSDRRLVNAAGVDVSGLLSGADTPVTGTPVTVALTAGLSARWYLEVKRTDTP